MTTSDLPGDLGGTHPFVAWGNRLVRALRRRTLLPGLGYKLRESEGGVTLEILPGGGGLTTLRCFRCKSVPADKDYVVARTWDGTTEGSTDIYIAKNLETRQPATETIAGEVWTYTYSTGADANNQYRTAVKSGVSESQVVVPYWICDSSASATIWAAECFSGVTKDAGLPTEQKLKLMVVTARCWAKRA